MSCLSILALRTQRHPNNSCEAAEVRGEWDAKEVFDFNLQCYLKPCIYEHPREGRLVFWTRKSRSKAAFLLAFDRLSIHADVGVRWVVGAVFDHLCVPKFAHHADLELLTNHRHFGGYVTHADLFFKVHGVAT
jgi:hypothetical protein